MIEAEAFAYQAGDEWQQVFKFLFAGNDLRDFTNGLKFGGAFLALPASDFKVSGSLCHMLFETANQILDFSSHPVECFCQIADFVVGLNINTLVKLAGSKGERPLGEFFHRFCQHTSRQVSKDCPYEKYRPEKPGWIG